MPQFEIEQYELHVQKYLVAANSQAEAIAKLFRGEAEPTDGSLELVEVADDFGMPSDAHADLADELRDLDIAVDDVIPSIRCITTK